MPKPVPTRYAAVVVVRRGSEYLLIQECRPPQPWYLPAGRAERGETLVACALRETREEAGVEVELEGLLRLEHVPDVDGHARIRAFFLARPKGDALPKSHADEHSLLARWLTLEQIRKLPLRHNEVVEVLTFLERGGRAAPLDLLAARYTPWR